MVIKPSQEAFQKLQSKFGSRGRPRARSSHPEEFFDMDLVNMEFACRDQVLVLPKAYATLDSEFRHGEGC